MGKDPCRLLGAWDDSLLLLQGHLDEKGAMEFSQKGRVVPSTYTLLKFDLMTGHSKILAELQGKGHGRATAAFHQGSFYVFTAAGSVLRVDARSETWNTGTLTTTTWKDAGLTLCKETGEYANPFLFGRAFLDVDGSILIPAQVFLPLDREDIERAWSKLPQARRAELVRTGLWPVTPDKEVGWKDEACFLRFNPETHAIAPLERRRFAHLVTEQDKNFLTHPFKDVDPERPYVTDGGRIQPMGEATVESERESKPVESHKKQSGTPTKPNVLTPSAAPKQLP